MGNDGTVGVEVINAFIRFCTWPALQSFDCIMAYIKI